ncbi:neurotensin receptor type 1 [Crotalus tigris]|uniref:neurotensin receptor type 1 n=1 Tax=Crotalus tigris TaxID=88082 RepID=UPI00192F1680|nr:neurotensin receptor type 1 [Crotalus tigris]
MMGQLCRAEVLPRPGGEADCGRQWQQQRGGRSQMLTRFLYFFFLSSFLIQVNVFISFVFPMAIISILNTIIANQLIIMFKQAAQENQVCTIGGQQTMLSMSMEPGRVQTLKHGVRVLRAVVIAFVVCWLPYHVRRLMYCYISEKQWSDFLYDFYHYFYMLTNILFYVSSAINPVLYNLVSTNFRQIFFSTFISICLPSRKKKKRTKFNRKSNSISSNHTFSSQVTRETIY